MFKDMFTRDIQALQPCFPSYDCGKTECKDKATVGIVY